MSTSVHISLSNEAWEKRLRLERHYLYDIDLDHRTAFCAACGPTTIHVPESQRWKEKPKVFCITRFLELEKAGSEKGRSKEGLKPRHTLSEIDVEKRTAICSVCGPTEAGKRKINGCVRYVCANRERKYRRKYGRTHYSSRSSFPRAHALLQVDEENKTGVCRTCGPVTIYIWQYKGRISRRCSNASVSRCPGAKKIRQEINTNVINRYKVENGCKNCGYKSNLLRLTIYNTIGRKRPANIGRLLKLNSSQLTQKLESCEVFCTDCRS